MAIRIRKRRVYHALAGCLLAVLAQAASAQTAKTFLVIQAHHDDHTWDWGFGGFAAKLAEEGWTGYFVRTTNDEKDSSTGWGEGDQINLKESREAIAALGMKGVISLNWRNDHMDSTPITDLRAQYILLIRKYRPEIVMTFNPWGHYDRNPDHRRVARAAGEALWLSGYSNVHPEHAEVGAAPYRVPKVYFGHRDDYGYGHTPNFSLKLTPEQLRKKTLAWWAHKNVRGNPPTNPPQPGEGWEVERMVFRDEWDHLPGLKAVLP
jgi:LmbE family N-acetylglucosaminyl deacetylase